jgi:hypothetical protein
MECVMKKKMIGFAAPFLIVIHLLVIASAAGRNIVCAAEETTDATLHSKTLSIPGTKKELSGEAGRMEFLSTLEESLRMRKVQLKEAEERIYLSQKKLHEKIKTLSNDGAEGIHLASTASPYVVYFPASLVIFLCGFLAGRTMRRRCPSKTGAAAKKRGDFPHLEQPIESFVKDSPGAQVPAFDRSILSRVAPAKQEVDGRWKEIQSLSMQGLTPLMIAKRLQASIGEVQFVLNLIRRTETADAEETLSSCKG